MGEPQVAPYGSWKSPITSESIATGGVRLGQVKLDGDDVYWIESRPAEQGRNVIVRRTPDGNAADVTPPGFNARTRAHEYGGGAFAVSDGVVWFSNFDDQRLYRQDFGAAPEPLTPEADRRYADAVVDRARRRLICVREDHTATGNEAVNALVAIDMDGGDTGEVLVSGNDFYASPRLSPDGSRLVYLTWNHPNMPWDGTELWGAQIADDGSLVQMERIAGGVEESVFQPQWAPDGALFFVSDRTGWWNLYRWRDGEVEPLTEMEAEFGFPQWVFGMSTYGVESTDRVVCAYARGGAWNLARLETNTGRLDRLDVPYTTISDLQVAAGRAAFVAASLNEENAVILLELATERIEILRRSSDTAIDAAYISSPEAIEFPTEDRQTAHAFFYRPRNPDYVGPEDDLPPLVVFSHGGPTASTVNGLRPEIQYWTSRGIAVVDVNYGGSTGYGRAYRERLKGKWGIVDVDDCVNAARYGVERGWADGDRLAIRGGSAGGYTTLCALTFRDVFKAGASYYGVSDLEALTKETHKFESRYLDGLVGPYPQRRDLYVQRSAIHFTERLSCPVIFLQGLEDKVVLPNQAEMMVDALREKGLPVAYLPFEGEQHGFRRSENIQRALDGELYFYSRIFGFDLADPVEPVEIENL